MNRATPEMRALAERVIRHESRGRKPSTAGSAGTYLACEKLRPLLATLMGKEGFRALLSRALAVASAEARELCAIQVNADGLLEGWQEVDDPKQQAEIEKAGTVLLAHLLGLLVAFIGEVLTLRVVREAWPKVSLTDPSFNRTPKQ